MITYLNSFIAFLTMGDETKRKNAQKQDPYSKMFENLTSKTLTDKSLKSAGIKVSDSTVQKTTEMLDNLNKEPKKTLKDKGKFQ